MIYNFMPFSRRTQKQINKAKKSCRFEELNGFLYHSNWLENIRTADAVDYRLHEWF